MRRENRSLGDEIKDLMEQISEGGRSIHEIEKQRKKLESEKLELEGALGDAETALEAEENKFLRMSLEINLVKADIEKRLQEKDEEFESTRRNHTKAMEQMQFAIEQESKSKAEAVRIKKKLELGKVFLLSLSSQPVDHEDDLAKQVVDNDRGLDLGDSDEDEDFTSGDEGSDSEPMIDSLRGNSGRMKSGVKSKFPTFK